MSKNLVGQIVATRTRGYHVLVAAKALELSDGKYTVEFGAGNVEKVDADLVSVPPAWLVEKWHEMRNSK